MLTKPFEIGILLCAAQLYLSDLGKIKLQANILTLPTKTEVGDIENQEGTSLQMRKAHDKIW